MIGHAYYVQLSEAEAASAKVAAEIVEARWVSVKEALQLPVAPLTVHYFVPLVERLG